MIKNRLVGLNPYDENKKNGEIKIIN